MKIKNLITRTFDIDLSTYGYKRLTFLYNKSIDNIRMYSEYKSRDSQKLREVAHNIGNENYIKDYTRIRDVIEEHYPEVRI